jgi:hypothetical protein
VPVDDVIVLAAGRVFALLSQDFEVVAVIGRLLVRQDLGLLPITFAMRLRNQRA